MKIYTRSGDAGETSLFGAGRVPKNHARVEAYGTIDELSAVLGMVAAQSGDAALRLRLEVLQADLFTVGADLATPPGSPAAARLARLGDDRVAELEAEIDAMTSELAPLATFIVPGGTVVAATLHVARTVCRRAERRVVEAIASGEEISPVPGAYLNRLGDWLFVAARLTNHRAGVRDVPWRGGDV